MNGTDRRRIKWKNLKQRLRFNGIGCCGATWTPPPPTISTVIQQRHDDHDEDDGDVTSAVQSIDRDHQSTATTEEATTDPSSMGIIMNLATALAAERQARDGGGDETEVSVKTLMRLIEETDGVDWRNSKKIKKKKNEGDGGVVGSDSVCCVCMDRNKSAAFVPCGHVFCRVCSRQLSGSRGSCPICNRTISKVLDLY